MNYQGVDLKNQINAKREELNNNIIAKASADEILQKSMELDELIVEYLRESESLK